ncbi:MAG TPA: hypothetical protein VFU21_14590 [Kofleriaceae bacterium]|nr:hypothetical protein [Kofleriaceae bacterium]
MTSTRTFALLALALAACGDNADPPSADGGPDSVDAAGDGTTATAFAVGTDFVAAGIASAIDIPALAVTQNAVDGVASTDPVVRHGDGRVYIVNRFGADNVTVLDARSLQLVAQISPGAGSNPPDVAADGDLLYVATLAGPGLVVLDLARPDEGVVDTIDLSRLDRTDGEPNCHSAVRVDRRLAVVCGILDEEYQPRARGRVAVIDLDSGRVRETVLLEHRRPFGFAMAVAAGPLSGDLLVPTVPKFLDPAADGCVERVQLAADPPVSGGCLVDNQTLGGFAAGLTTGADGAVWMAVTTGFDPDDYGPVGYAAAWDPAAGAVQAPITGSEVRAMDVAACPGGALAVSDATLGVRVYGDSGAELTEAPLDLGLPPVANGLVCY